MLISLGKVSNTDINTSIRPSQHFPLYYRVYALVCKYYNLSTPAELGQTVGHPIFFLDA